MAKLRLLFSKREPAHWISHLDLMRTFQRAFLRAGLPLKHTEGFHPHAFLSFALPLSVGVESVCELLDVELVEDVGLETIPERLNRALPSGIRVLRCYTGGRPVRELCFAEYETALFWECPPPPEARERLEALFVRDSLIVPKRQKKTGQEADQDIRPMIRRLELQTREDGILADAVLAAQNPSLNPAYLIEAIRRYLPELAPDFTSVVRKRVLDGELNAFE